MGLCKLKRIHEGQCVSVTYWIGELSVLRTMDGANGSMVYDADG